MDPVRGHQHVAPLLVPRARRRLDHGRRPASVGPAAAARPVRAHDPVAVRHGVAPEPRAHCVEQDGLQVAPVDGILRHGVASVLAARVGDDERGPRPARVVAELLGFDRDGLERGLEAEAVQGKHAARLDVYADPERLRGGRGFEHPYTHPRRGKRPVEGKGESEPPDAAARDDDLQGAGCCAHDAVPP